MIRRRDDRAIASAGVLLAAGLVGLAAVSAVEAALGGTVWLPLHIALAGAAGTAIAAVLPFFTTALGKVAPASPPIRIGAIGLIAGGSLVAAVGMSTGQSGLAAIGGATYIGGLAATAAAAFLPLRRALGYRPRLVDIAYLVAIGEVVLGVALATAMLAGWSPAESDWGALKPAHAWLNVFGFVTLVIAASLTHLAPTVAGARIRPRRSASVALGALILGAPLVALGFASGWVPAGWLGALVELVGGSALVIHGAAVQRDRGRWTSDHGWHRFAGLSLVAAPGWLLATLAIGAGRVLWLGPTPQAWDVRLVAVPLVAGWIGQVLIASWTHLVPAIGPGDQARHAVQRQWLGRAATPRWLLWNGGVALATAGLLANAGVLVVLGGGSLGIALALALGLLAASTVAGRASRSTVAG
ncbi:MAG TPA: hypothetical protein VF494_00530 [Candidatus Limnocylindrales bacterium]